MRLFVFIFCMIITAEFAGSAAAHTAAVENYVESSANTGGATAPAGASVSTGTASADAHVETETNESSGTTVVDVTVSANNETKTVHKEVGGNASVTVEATAAGTGQASSTVAEAMVRGDTATDGANESEQVPITNIKISRVPAEDPASGMVAAILSVIKKAFSHVLSIFG